MRVQHLILWPILRPKVQCSTWLNENELSSFFLIINLFWFNLLDELELYFCCSFMLNTIISDQIFDRITESWIKYSAFDEMHDTSKGYGKL